MAIALVAALSVLTYRSAVDDSVSRHANQQLAVVRTVAVALDGELLSLSSQLRQFSSLPSVQHLELAVLGQRVNAAFGANSSKVLNFVARVDARGRLYYWTPSGQQMADGERLDTTPEVWEWAQNRRNAGQVRLLHGWSKSRPWHRALAVPIWRTAPMPGSPTPINDFNGVLAFVIDLNRVVETYLGPATRELANSALAVSLTTPQFGLQMDPGRKVAAPTPADAHDHVEPQGTTILIERAGRRVHSWAKVTVADETWVVASSVPYALAAGRIRQSAMAQLALMATLLLALPFVSWLILRRDRRVREEQRVLERRLAESQKTEAIGKLAGGIAHDFNNRLTAILGYASMIEEDAPPRSAIRDQALQIRKAAENAASLTQKLLAYSRRQMLQADALDFRSMLGNLLQLVRRAVGEDITVYTQMGEDLWPILADHAQVEQSIVNLAINAREAMPNGGTLQISARNAPRPNGERRPDADVKPGDYVQITVTDTGTGMDETTRRRMFEPFFTTKAPGQGTGLGLSTVYGFVRQCGGYVGVMSTPGQGTSIELLLPRASAPSVGDAPTPVPVARGGRAGKETILVAEDEDGVRLLAVESLTRQGYRVIAAASGEEALTAAGAVEGTIHLLLSDVVMPGMKGPELAGHLRALRPGIRVLLMSGYAADVVQPHDLEEATLLSKPFSPAELTKAVRSVLDEPQAPATAPQTQNLPK